jgi:transposase InsO family protein
VLSFLEAAGLEPKRTSVRAPWQNGIAERWIGSCRREILDHTIALNEGHLRRILRDSLAKDTPNRRGGGATARRECESAGDGAVGRPASSLHLGLGGLIGAHSFNPHRDTQFQSALKIAAD